MKVKYSLILLILACSPTLEKDKVADYSFFSNILGSLFGSGSNTGTKSTSSSSSSAYSTLWKTGLATCYTGNTNTPEACNSTHTGQDGNDQKGVTRSFTGPTAHAVYTSDYTVTDTMGRIWKSCMEGLSDVACATGGTPSSLTFLAAQTACSNLNTLNAGAGYSGITTWRLPSFDEIRYLSYFGGSSPFIQTTYFPNSLFPSLFLWSDTSYAPNPSNVAKTIRQGGYGEFMQNLKTNLYQTRCVSGPADPAPSFTDNGDGTVKDNNTNLTWQKCMYNLSDASCSSGSVVPLDWNSAINYCNTLTLAGKTWRLANLYELSSLVDHNNASAPMIFTTYFPNTPLGDTNSSTTNSVAGDTPYSVTFTDGSANYLAVKSTAVQFRCVSSD